MHVRFRGMPNVRWWDFESGTTDFGDIQPDKRDLGKLVIMDFMLVAGNDWFVIPFDQRVGTLSWVNNLVVHDVFGDMTLVKRAEQMDTAAGTPAPGERWTMFSLSREDNPADLADFFLLPLSAATAVQAGVTLEEVRFLRDEMANTVWAVEHITENGVGQPWLGHERDVAVRSPLPPTPGTSPDGSTKPPLRYQIQTIVPVNWIPFVPVQVSVGDTIGRSLYVLEIATMPDVLSRSVPPVGRILQPTNLAAGQPYQIREGEVARTGTRVARAVYRTRWIDGSTHLWIARRKSAGTGEGSSGIRFDQALPNDSASTRQ
jgi:hypothetical protein